MIGKTIRHLPTFLLAVTFSLPGESAVINFEQINGTIPFEGMAISNQFQAHYGISFRRAGLIGCATCV